MNQMQMIQSFPQFMQQMKGKTPEQALSEIAAANGLNQTQMNQLQQQAQAMAQQMTPQLNQFKSMFGF